MSAEYQKPSFVSPPKLFFSFILPNGNIDTNSYIEIESTTEGARIFYTTNGAVPRSADGIQADGQDTRLFTRPFKLNDGYRILKAVAVSLTGKYRSAPITRALVVERVMSRDEKLAAANTRRIGPDGKPGYMQSSLGRASTPSEKLSTETAAKGVHRFYNSAKQKSSKVVDFEDKLAWQQERDRKRTERYCDTKPAVLKPSLDLEGRFVAGKAGKGFGNPPPVQVPARPPSAASKNSPFVPKAAAPSGAQGGHVIASEKSSKEEAFWRSQLDAVAIELKSYARDNMAFREAVGGAYKLGSLASATVINDGHRFTLTVSLDFDRRYYEKYGMNTTATKNSRISSGSPSGGIKNNSEQVVRTARQYCDGRGAALYNDSDDDEAVRRQRAEDLLFQKYGKAFIKDKKEELRNQKNKTTYKTPMEVKALLLEEICCQGRAAVVEDLLITRNGDPNWCNKSGVPLLTLSAKHGHWEILRLLVKHGALLNTRTQEKANTALHAAIASRHSAKRDCVETLLALGADTQIVNAKGLTAYELAVLSAQPDILTCFRTGRPPSPLKESKSNFVSPDKIKYTDKVKQPVKVGGGTAKNGDGGNFKPNFGYKKSYFQQGRQSKDIIHK